MDAFKYKLLKTQLLNAKYKKEKEKIARQVYNNSIRYGKKFYKDIDTARIINLLMIAIEELEHRLPHYINGIKTYIINNITDSVFREYSDINSLHQEGKILNFIFDSTKNININFEFDYYNLHRFMSLFYSDLPKTYNINVDLFNSRIDYVPIFKKKELSSEEESAYKIHLFNSYLLNMDEYFKKSKMYNIIYNTVFYGHKHPRVKLLFFEDLKSYKNKVEHMEKLIKSNFMYYNKVWSQEKVKNINKKNKSQLELSPEVKYEFISNEAII